MRAKQTAGAIAGCSTAVLAIDRLADASQVCDPVVVALAIYMVNVAGRPAPMDV
jgi:hypothetical protein